MTPDKKKALASSKNKAIGVVQNKAMLPALQKSAPSHKSKDA